MKTNTKEFRADKEKYSITDIVKTVENYFNFSASTNQIGNIRRFLQRKCNELDIQNVGSDGKKLISKKDVEWLINIGCYKEFVQYARKAHEESRREKELKELYTYMGEQYKGNHSIKTNEKFVTSAGVITTRFYDDDCAKGIEILLNNNLVAMLDIYEPQNEESEGEARVLIYNETNDVPIACVTINR